MLELSSRLCKTRELPSKTIENETVLLDMDEGEVIRLSEIGAQIWSLIDGAKSVEDIISHIYKTFDAEKKIIEKDTLHFLKKLIKMELVKLI